jgi:GR25 family glycosyltransferase involved in LPS biosynthesis
MSGSLKSLSDIKHCLYINLDSRIDRRIHIEQELPKIGIVRPIFERFNAICLPKKSGSSAIGCSMSHLKCLEIAKKNKWSHVLIVEDDIQFIQPEKFVANMNAFLNKYKSNNSTPEFDVCLIAGNNFPPFSQPFPFCVKVTKCQTTTGYLVLEHYYDTLIKNIRTGINYLLKDPEVRIGPQYTKYQLLYSIDKWWFQLQEKDRWYLITPLTVSQREDYSDIEERQTNYSPCMLVLNKQILSANSKKYCSVNKANILPSLEYL